MYSTELYHHGVKGMKWGVRRYQNTDGTLTSAGQKRYSDGTMRLRDAKANLKSTRKAFNNAYNSAYDYSYKHPISQYLSKKTKAESDRRWKEVQTKAADLRIAKSEYKAAKVGKKAAIKAADILAKADLRELRIKYDFAFNSAYDYSSAHPISQFVSKKVKAESDRRWKEAQTIKDEYNAARNEYKAVKSAEKAVKKLAKTKTKDL